LKSTAKKCGNKEKDSLKKVLGSQNINNEKKIFSLAGRYFPCLTVLLYYENGFHEILG
jgi:hypothetical protein